ncbi:Alpha-L-fucosidase [Rubripirellula amarantea]|uniref:alpha-L-fucosidase n=1 Tax=Rubripirellula amarantea TaxID=2527999 RepID=A0A5C5WHK1_9BACT|nr:alpha-L-fucosidase [Rubripirellula amarantea]TWT50276.1 Alpha-L-fucosidase [Rubripirellula amarantea]
MKIRFLVAAIAVAVLTPSLEAQDNATATGPYQANWESLEKHNPAPEWFRDAKFGIYFHWGVYSVPAFGSEWYPRYMHDPKHKVHKHHVEKYGPVDQYGYDRFVQDFKAENFDAEEWCDLFQKSGAKFVGPVSEHHDGFAMWDSELTPWNSMDRGPQRDITGEMAVAAKKRGMKFVTTFHHARNNLWEKQPGKWSGHFDGAKNHFPKALENEERAFMYGYMPREKFLKMWNGKLSEVINQYSPDLIWFDSWLDEIPDANRMQFLADYFNHAEQTGQEVVVTYKQQDMPQNICVLDIEKGGLEGITDFAWLSDDTISMGSWCYTDSLRIKPTNVVLHSLIDIVTKNGQLILNLSPMADGTIPDNQRKVLLELGAWLEKYGESIYNTRPFVIDGHGPTVAGKGHFGGKATDIAYSAEDIRYTRNDNVVYAFALGWPGEGTQSVLKGFAASQKDAPRDIESVSLLGSDEKIEYELTDDGLIVTAPKTKTDDMAIVYKVTTK